MEVTVCATPLSAGGLVAVKPNPSPGDLLDVVTGLQDGTDTAVDKGMEVTTLLPVPDREAKPKLRGEEPEPKPVNPAKPLNAPVCTVYATQTLHHNMDKNSEGVLKLLKGSRASKLFR